MVWRDIYLALGGFVSELGSADDWDLYLRLSLDWRLSYVDCLAAKYRIWSGNMGWRRTAEWTIRVAEKHLAALPELDPTERQHARYGLLRRLASSHHVLVDQTAARRFALAAVREAPARGLLDSDVRRPLVRSFLPPRFLRTRRPA